MPFLDFNNCFTEADADGFDHTIVGAGAAGILLAVKLAAEGQRVLLVESGHLAQDEARQGLNEVEQSGKRMGNPVWSRKRAVGGTTTAWGGQSLPFSPLDLEARDWVDNSGWPISWDDLAAYYADANAFMGVDQLDYDVELFRRLKVSDPGFSPDVYYHFSKWAVQPNFYKLHGAALGRGVTVLYNAHLTRITLGPSSRVAQVEISSFNGKRIQAPVENLIVAAGGIETNRILLLNDHQMAGGLGNHSGWLGKAVMDHPCLEVGRLRSDQMRALQRAFGTHVHRGRKYSLRLSTSPQWQRRCKTLNASASVLWTYPDGDVDPFGALKDLIRTRRPALLPGVAKALPRLAQSMLALATEGLVYKPGATPRLVFMAEQEPTTGSYIALGEKVDRFGARFARINWRITEKTWRTIVSFSQVLVSEAERLRLGQVALGSHIRADNPDWEQYLSDVNHHMGGTRMSAEASDGVVDPQLRVWGIANLYICSASVFPTSSHSNPTLTLLALAVRMVDHLCGRPSAGRPDST